MSSVSSCRTRCGYPEHAVAIKHPDRKLLRRAKTVPYPTYCISSAAPPFDTVDLSRNVPTVFAVLSAPVRWFRFSSARFVTGHGQALAACHVHIRRHIQTLTTAPLTTHTPTFQAGRSTAFGLFFLTTLPDISAIPATSASIPLG